MSLQYLYSSLVQLVCNISLVVQFFKLTIFSGSGSPLGELMDHGIDSNCMWMLPVTLMSKLSFVSYHL